MTNKYTLRISPKAARVNANITQRDAAVALEVDPSTLRRYENGETVPPWDVVEKMEELYRIDRDNLFFKARNRFKQ